MFFTHTDSISPFFETREQALEFKSNSLEEYPDCFVAKYTFEYNLESDPARLELLDKIVGTQNLGAKKTD